MFYIIVITNNAPSVKGAQKQVSEHMGITPNRNKNHSQNMNPYEINQFNSNQI